LGVAPVRVQVRAPELELVRGPELERELEPAPGPELALELARGPELAPGPHKPQAGLRLRTGLACLTIFSFSLIYLLLLSVVLICHFLPNDTTPLFLRFRFRYI